MTSHGFWLLQDSKGKFLMTINDTPKIREIFDCFAIEEVPLQYSMSAAPESRAKIHTELLISNSS
jgi:DNA adenine methylase